MFFHDPNTAWYIVAIVVWFVTCTGLFVVIDDDDKVYVPLIAFVVAVLWQIALPIAAATGICLGLALLIKKIVGIHD